MIMRCKECPMWRSYDEAKNSLTTFDDFFKDQGVCFGSFEPKPRYEDAPVCLLYRIDDNLGDLVELSIISEEPQGLRMPEEKY